MALHTNTVNDIIERFERTRMVTIESENQWLKKECERLRELIQTALDEAGGLREELDSCRGHNYWKEYETAKKECDCLRRTLDSVKGISEERRIAIDEIVKELRDQDDVIEELERKLKKKRKDSKKWKIVKSLYKDGRNSEQVVLEAIEDLL